MASGFSYLQSFSEKPLVPSLHKSKPMRLQDSHILTPWQILSLTYIEVAVLGSGYDVRIRPNVGMGPCPALTVGSDSNDVDKREVFILHELLRFVSLYRQIVAKDAWRRIRCYTMDGRVYQISD
jgi:hypothetical protein